MIITRDEWFGVHKQRHYQQVRLEPSQTDAHTFAGIRFDLVDSEGSKHDCHSDSTA